MYDEEPEVLEDMETLTEADDDHGKFAVMMIRESSSWNCCYMDRNERREVPRAAARWRARRHDVTTLPALANYHERPRRTLTTRGAGDRTGMLAESHSLGETAGRRLSVASRGSYDKAGYVGMGWTVWSVGRITRGSDALAQACPPPPCGSSTRSSRQERDRHTGRYWHHFPMSPLAFVFW